MREHSHEAVTLEQIAARADVSEMTIFNLVGNRAQIWASLAERALAQADPRVNAICDPRRRAEALVDAITDVVIANAEVFRAAVHSWSGRARVVAGDPTSALEACFADAKAAGAMAATVRPRHTAELVSAALLGVMHQWAGGIIDDRQLVTRARDMVDLAFAAARP